MNKREIDENFHFPKYNLEKIDIENELKSAKIRIYEAQNSGQGSQECFLSFYPVAKNIRFVSSHFYNAVKNNRLKGYGTDVLSGEQGDNSHWLKNNVVWKAFQSGDPRFLILPHIGGAVKENIPVAEMAVLKILIEINFKFLILYNFDNFYFVNFDNLTIKTSFNVFELLNISFFNQTILFHLCFGLMSKFLFRISIKKNIY